MFVRFDLRDLCSDGVNPRRCRPRALLAAILLPASLALLLDSTRPLQATVLAVVRRW